MKKWGLRLVVILFLLVIAGVVVTIYFLGGIVKRGVERVGPQITRTTVKLDSATLSVFSGNGELKNFVVGNPQGFSSPSAVKVGSVSMSVEPRSVFAQKVIVHKVKLEGPEITFEGGLGGNNLSKILGDIRASAKKDGQTPSKQEQSSSKRFQVDDFLITGGKINLTTALLGGQSTSLNLPEIQLTGLGRGSQGVTAAELSELIFRALLDETLKQVAKGSLGKSLQETMKSVGGTQGVENVTRGLGDLLRKK